MVPPIVADLIRSRGQRADPDWYWIGAEWPEGLDPEGPGWDVETVLTTYMRRWPSFIDALAATGPFRASPDSDGSSTADLAHHNATMVFAYALLFSGHERAQLRMLDWGGGLGHYLAMARALAPQIEMSYTCRDLSLLVAQGRALFPEARFVDDDSCFDRAYDFVLASASLHYSKDWAGTLRKLADATAGHLLVTRAPMVESASSFVFTQRPPDYSTEYPGWCLNRPDFLRMAESVGLVLIREFDLGFAPVIASAPEQNRFRGFLFRGTQGGGSS